MEIREGEYWRKGIHFSGLFMIPVLLWNPAIFAALLALFLAIYLAVELLMKKGLEPPLLGKVAKKSKRESEEGKVSRGAVLLFTAGIVLPFMLGKWSAAVGLSQVFVADVASTLVGIKWGTKKLPYSRQKTWVGSLAYFAAAFAIALPFVPPWEAAILALLGTIVESIPLPELDNMTIPLAVGTAAFLISWPS